MGDYSEKLKDPRWQKLRLRVMERDQFTCQICYDVESTLNVHHRNYVHGFDPWDYHMSDLVTLCEDCHESEGLNRKEYSEEFNKVFNRYFFMVDKKAICGSILNSNLKYPSDVISSLIGFLMQEKNMQDLLFTKLIEFCKRKKEN